MMKSAALLVLLGLCSGAAAERPRPVITLTTRMHVTAAAVWVVYSVSATAGPDKVDVAVSATGQASQTKSFTGSSKTDSVAFLHPAQGASISGTVTPTAWKLGTAYPGTPKAWGPYTEPVIPPTTVVDSVRVTPTSSTLTPGQTVQFIATVYSHTP